MSQLDAVKIEVVADKRAVAEQVGRSIVRGAAVGAVAAVALGAGLLLASRAGRFGHRPTKRALGNILRRAGLLGRSSAFEVSSALSHVAYGAAMGASYGLVASRLTSRTSHVATGLGLGASAWAASQAGVAPAFGLLAAPKHRNGNALMLAAHCLFGSALGLLFNHAGRNRSRLSNDGLDQQLDQSFPASDPPSATQAVTPGSVTAARNNTRQG